MATLAAAPSATVTLTPAPAGWWLRDPLDPALNRRVWVHDDTLEFSSDEPQDVLRPLGRAAAVVVTGGVVHEPSTSVTFACPAPADVQGLAALRAGTRTLFLSSPYGEAWYVRLGRSVRRARPMGSRTVDTVQVEAVVVDRP